MKRSRFTVEQIIGILRQAAAAFALSIFIVRTASRMRAESSVE